MHKKEYKRGLSHTEQAIYFSCIGKGRKLVTIEEIEKEYKLSRAYARKLLHSLAKKEAAYGIGRGTYAIVPAEVMASKNTIVEIIPSTAKLMEKIGAEYCFAFQTAAYLHGGVTQIPFAVQVAVKKQRRPISVLNTEIKFFKVKESHFSGIEKIKYGAENINVTDKEKTAIDCLERYKLCGGIDEVVNTIRDMLDELDIRKLIEYSSRYDYALRQRLGLILEKLGVEKQLLKKIKISKNVYLLDYLAERKGKLNEKWNVIENVRAF